MCRPLTNNWLSPVDYEIAYYNNIEGICLFNCLDPQCRPVGVLVNMTGSLLVADDVENMVWFVRPVA
ncbi:MAG: hypothetical protein WBP13_08005 [Methylophilaceae bacterium]